VKQSAATLKHPPAVLEKFAAFMPKARAVFTDPIQSMENSLSDMTESLSDMTDSLSAPNTPS